MRAGDRRELQIGKVRQCTHETLEACTDAYGVQIRLPRADRRELVAVLDQGGMTTRAIAPVVGAGIGTVSRDLEAVVPFGTPASPRTKTGLGEDLHRPAPTRRPR